MVEKWKGCFLFYLFRRLSNVHRDINLDSERLLLVRFGIIAKHSDPLGTIWSKKNEGYWKKRKEKKRGWNKKISIYSFHFPISPNNEKRKILFFTQITFADSFPLPRFVFFFQNNSFDQSMNDIIFDTQSTTTPHTSWVDEIKHLADSNISNWFPYSILFFYKKFCTELAFTSVLLTFICLDNFNHQLFDYFRFICF